VICDYKPLFLKDIYDKSQNKNGILSRTSYIPIKISAKVPEPIKTVGIIGGVVAGACAVGAGISYLCTPSNEKVIIKAQNAKSDTQLFHGAIIRQFESKKYMMSEADLIALAESYMYGSLNIGELRDACNELSRVREDLDDRMYRLERKGKDYGADYRSMDRLVGDLISLESSLGKIVDYLERHENYFRLFVAETEIRQQYGSVIDIMDLYGSKPLALAQHLREYIALQSVTQRDLYPTISYVEKLDTQMSRLDTALLGWQRTYKYALLTQANTLYSKLSQIRSTLLADDRYVSEVQERERARREEERLRIERERIAAEQRKAEAAAEQARQLRRQNDMLHEQNEILRRQTHQSNRSSDYDRYGYSRAPNAPLYH